MILLTREKCCSKWVKYSKDYSLTCNSDAHHITNILHVNFTFKQLTTLIACELPILWRLHFETKWTVKMTLHGNGLWRYFRSCVGHLRQRRWGTLAKGGGALETKEVGHFSQGRWGTWDKGGGALETREVGHLRQGRWGTLPKGGGVLYPREVGHFTQGRWGTLPKGGGALWPRVGQKSVFFITYWQKTIKICHVIIYLIHNTQQLPQDQPQPPRRLTSLKIQR